MSDFTLLLEAGKGQKGFLKKIWRYRELLFFLAWRDVIVRYRQTVLGILWVIVRPFLAVGVFSFVFGKLARLPHQGVPYPVLVFSGMLPWQFFVSCLLDSSNSLIMNVNLISKIYFPRLIIPISTALVALVDFLVMFVFFLIMLIVYHIPLNWHFLFLPFLLCWVGLISLGFGFWFSSLNVKYRDFRYVVPFLVQLALYLSPVGFSSSIIPAKWRLLFSLNPLVGVIDGFRWAMLPDSSSLYLPGTFISLAFILIVFVSGLFHFLRTEKEFADII